MIIREWRGRAMLFRSDAYPKHFRDIVVPELRSLSGFLGAHLSQRHIGGQVEFLVLTRWQSMEAIGAFAGSSVDRAVVEPGAIAALIDFDRDMSALPPIASQMMRRSEPTRSAATSRHSHCSRFSYSITSSAATSRASGT